MKIVMFCDFMASRFLIKRIWSRTQYVRQGHAVTVIASTFESIFDFTAANYDGGRQAKTVVTQGVKIIRLPYRLNIANRIRFFASVGQILEREAPNLIFFHDIMLNLINGAQYVRTHPRTRMILDYHADYSNSGKSWLSRHVLHGVIRRSAFAYARPYLDGIFPVTPASARFLHELYGVAHEQMELLPLGSDLDLARDVQRSGHAAALRARHGIGKDAFVIFTGGKLTPSKRTELLVQTFKDLDNNNAWLVIAGDCTPSDTAYRDALIQSATDCPRIIFTGWLGTRELFEHIDIADVGVFPASQSVVWQHVIALGKPLIIGEPQAQSQGSQDFTYLNLYGNVVITDRPIASAQRLMTAIELLFNDQALRRRMGEGARRVAAEKLDWNITINKTLQFNN